jgi:hypothetical protein
MMLTMLETSGFLGWLSAALLFAAVAAWLKLGRGPLLQMLNGRDPLKTAQVEGASRLLVIAVTLSAVAAGLAIAGSMFG